MDNRVDQYCENIVMSSLVSFQGNRGATIRNHVLVCLRTGLAERTEWIRCFPPSEQVCCGRQLLYQCFSGEIEQRTSKFVDFFRPPCYCRSIQMFIHCSNDLALGFNPYLPEVGYNIPQACLVAKLSQLPTFEKSVVPHD
jgi:hypothetical protein